MQVGAVGFYVDCKICHYSYVCVFFNSFNSLKVEMEKITNEKGEMHRHYIMVGILKHLVQLNIYIV